MAEKSEEMVAQCPSCEQEIFIIQRWKTVGACAYGGYVLECDKCGARYTFHLGRDIKESRVLRGAKVLDSYDEDLNNKAEVLGRYGLTEFSSWIPAASS